MATWRRVHAEQSATCLDVAHGGVECDTRITPSRTVEALGLLASCWRLSAPKPLPYSRRKGDSRAARAVPTTDRGVSHLTRIPGESSR